MTICLRQLVFFGCGSLLCLLPFGFLLETHTLLWQRCLSVAAGLMCLLAGLSLLQNRKRPLRIIQSDLFVALYLAYGAVQCLVHRADIPGSLVASWTIVAAFYLVARNSDSRTLPAFLWVACLAQAVVAMGQYAALLPSRHALYAATGTFWNPSQLGGFLACLLPMLAADLPDRKPRFLFAGLLLLSLVALVLSDSRAAWLACLVGVLYVFRLVPKKKIHIGLAVVVALAVVAALWFYKPLSALGRLHLWKISAGMVADAPLFGSGVHSFPALYMPCQARYFESHPDDAFADLAAVVTTPYNEPLHILVEQGFIGLALFLLLCGSFFLRQTDENRRPTAVLLAFLVFACFSYPGENVALLSVLACCLGSSQGKTAFALSSAPFVRPVSATIPLLAFCLCAMVFAHYQNLARILRSPAQEISIAAFRNEPDALQLLSVRRQALSSDQYAQVLEWLSARCPSPATYCALGELCERREDFACAERLYREAALMVPNQIQANYHLFNLYEKNGRPQAALDMALRLSRQHVKIENSFTLSVQGEAIRYVKQHAPQPESKALRQTEHPQSSNFSTP